MKILFACCLPCLLASVRAADEQSLSFTTTNYVVDMKVRSPQRYLGSRLSFYDTNRGRETCLTAEGNSSGCIERFVGALAIVNYEVRVRKTGEAARASIREEVTILEQAPGLLARPFQKSQRLVRGQASDIQLFGYDEGLLEPAEREQARLDWTRSAFQVVRQQLFFNDDRRPFAVIEWKHFLDRIVLVRVQGVGCGTTASGERADPAGCWP